MGPKCLLDSIGMSNVESTCVVVDDNFGLFCLWMYSLDSVGHFRSFRVPIGKNGIDWQDNRRHMPFQTSHLH